MRILLLVLLLVSLGVAAPTMPLEARLSFTTVPQRGTLVIHTFLHLKNVSDLANPIYLVYDPIRSVHVTVRDGQGQEVKQSMLPADVLTPSPYLVAVPYQGTVSFDITAFGYAYARNTPVFLGLPCGDWVLPHTLGYHVEGTFTGVTSSEETRRLWTGTLPLPPTSLAPPAVKDPVF